MWNNMALSMLRAIAHDNTYERVLDTISNGINAADNRISNVVGVDDDMYKDYVVDSECDLVENLLGSAFVVCQTHILSVASRASAIYKSVGITHRSQPYQLYDAKIQAIVSLANYFKHRVEWNGLDWEKISKNNFHAKRTISEIKKLGLVAGSTGNLRTGSEWLGNKDYVQTSRFVYIIDAWSEELISDCTSLVKPSNIDA